MTTDSKTTAGMVLRTESHPLPKSRSERMAAIEAILSPGGVQRLVLDLEKGMTVHRLVKGTVLDTPLEVLHDDLMSAVRNAEIVDLALPVLEAHVCLMRACSLLSQRRAIAKAVVVNSKPEFLKWLKVTDGMPPQEVFCIPLIDHKEMPEGAFLLVGGSEADPEEVVLTFRVEMHTIERKKK